MRNWKSTRYMGALARRESYLIRDGVILLSTTAMIFVKGGGTYNGDEELHT